MARLDRDGSIISIASYSVISKYEERTGLQPTGLYFNKMMSLLHNEMKARGKDLGLPHCWYRWGDEVVRYLMPNSIRWNHEEPQFTKVTWDGRMPSGMGNDPSSRLVLSIVQMLTEKYGSDDGVERYVADVYKYAPFEFQRSFRLCRETFRSKIQSGIDLPKYGRDFLWPMLEKAMGDFPSLEFPSIADKIEPFREVMRILLCEDGVDYRYANEVSEEFWTWFCYYLRLHQSCHENVPSETLSYWNERLPFEDERYKRQLGDHVVMLEKKGYALSPILKSISAYRKEETKREDVLFDSLGEDLEGMDEFLGVVRSSYRSN